MNTGTVKQFNRNKGYGFIIPSDKSEDVYFYKRDLIDQVDEGDKVSFDVKETPRGLAAINVRFCDFY